MQQEAIARAAQEPLFAALTAQSPDTLLALIGAFRADPRPGKIDVGVGVYRNEAGGTPVMAAVKAAERRLVDQQPTKSYLGPEGDVGFFNALKPVVFGNEAFGERLCGLQTPGGTGALRLACELIARARPGTRVFVGEPTWPNHGAIVRAPHLFVTTYQHFDIAAQQLTFAPLVHALDRAERGEVVLLHGCCHNPTGADFTLEQWTILAGILRERGLVPLIDLAYQGLGAGLDQDAAGVRLLLQEVGEGLVAYSCDKNFGLYRERVGALFALAPSVAQAEIVQSNLLALTRANWSMPPDHGAAIVRVILDTDELRSSWLAELAQMAARIRHVRTCLAEADGTLAPLRAQQGMFSTLALSSEQVLRLRADHGVYMPASGRINVAGLTAATVSTFVRALASVN